MGKIKIILWIGLPALISTVIFYFALPPREPSYHGQSLHEWVRVYTEGYGWGDAPQILEADDAIRHMGKRSLPFLVDMISARAFEGNPRDLLRAFWLLRGAAKPAVPRLTRLLNQPETSEAAANALGSIGADGLAGLVNAVSSTNPEVRASAVAALLNYYPWGGQEAEPNFKIDPDELRAMQAMEKTVVPALVGSINDPHTGPETRFYAMCILGEFHREPQVVVPLLVKILENPRDPERRGAAMNLGGFGEQGKAAVPILTRSLQDPDPMVREHSTNSLKKINAAVKAPQKEPKVGSRG